MPGSGSLAAGRPVGYFQMALYLLGFSITLVCAVGFFHWYFANAAEIKQQQQDDPRGAVLAFWRAARGAMAGFAIVVFSLAWSAVTSFQIMQSPRKDATPPRVK